VNAGPSAVQYAVHPARRGIFWLKQAAAMLSAARIPWLMLLLVYYLIQLIVSVVPLVGPLAMMVLRPVFTVGFLAAAWTQERGGTPAVRHLFRGFRTNLWALIPIGVTLIAGTTVAVLATVLVDGGALVEAITANAKPDEALASSGRVEAAMLFAIVCALPFLLAVWFAPALVVFQDCGPARALSGSLRASLANWKPVAIYGLMLFLYGAVLPGTAFALIAILVPSSIAPYVVAATVVPYVFLFVAAQTISDYVAYRDIFHQGERLAIGETTNDAAKA
jgi:hypothetical protein